MIGRRCSLPALSVAPWAARSSPPTDFGGASSRCRPRSENASLLRSKVHRLPLRNCAVNCSQATAGNHVSVCRPPSLLLFLEEQKATTDSKHHIAERDDRGRAIRPPLPLPGRGTRDLPAARACRCSFTPGCPANPARPLPRDRARARQFRSMKTRCIGRQSRVGLERGGERPQCGDLSLSPADIEALLELAREAAHQSGERTNAPFAHLVGVASARCTGR